MDTMKSQQQTNKLTKTLNKKIHDSNIGKGQSDSPSIVTKSTVSTSQSSSNSNMNQSTGENFALHQHSKKQDIDQETASLSRQSSGSKGSRKSKSSSKKSKKSALTLANVAEHQKKTSSTGGASINVSKDTMLSRSINNDGNDSCVQSNVSTELVNNLSGSRNIDKKSRSANIDTNLVSGSERKGEAALKPLGDKARSVSISNKEGGGGGKNSNKPLNDSSRSRRTKSKKRSSSNTKNTKKLSDDNGVAKEKQGSCDLQLKAIAGLGDGTTRINDAPENPATTDETAISTAVVENSARSGNHGRRQQQQQQNQTQSLSLKQVNQAEDSVSVSESLSTAVVDNTTKAQQTSVTHRFTRSARRLRQQELENEGNSLQQQQQTDEDGFKSIVSNSDITIRSSNRRLRQQQRQQQRTKTNKLTNKSCASSSGNENHGIKPTGVERQQPKGPKSNNSDIRNTPVSSKMHEQEEKQQAQLVERQQPPHQLQEQQHQEQLVVHQLQQDQHSHLLGKSEVQQKPLRTCQNIIVGQQQQQRAPSHNQQQPQMKQQAALERFRTSSLQREGSSKSVDSENSGNLSALSDPNSTVALASVAASLAPSHMALASVRDGRQNENTHKADKNHVPLQITTDSEKGGLNVLPPIGAKNSNSQENIPRNTSDTALHNYSDRPKRNLRKPAERRRKSDSNLQPPAGLEKVYTSGREQKQLQQSNQPAEPISKFHDSMPNMHQSDILVESDKAPRESTEEKRKMSLVEEKLMQIKQYEQQQQQQQQQEKHKQQLPQRAAPSSRQLRFQRYNSKNNISGGTMPQTNTLQQRGPSAYNHVRSAISSQQSNQVYDETKADGPLQNSASSQQLNLRRIDGGNSRGTDAGTTMLNKQANNATATEGGPFQTNTSNQPIAQRNSRGPPVFLVPVPHGVPEGAQFPVEIQGHKLMVTCPQGAKVGTQLRIALPPNPSQPQQGRAHTQSQGRDNMVTPGVPGHQMYDDSNRNVPDDKPKGMGRFFQQKKSTRNVLAQGPVGRPQLAPQQQQLQQQNIEQQQQQQLRQQHIEQQQQQQRMGNIARNYSDPDVRRLVVPEQTSYKREIQRSTNPPDSFENYNNSHLRAGNDRFPSGNMKHLEQQHDRQQQFESIQRQQQTQQKDGPKRQWFGWAPKTQNHDSRNISTNSPSMGPHHEPVSHTNQMQNDEDLLVDFPGKDTGKKKNTGIINTLFAGKRQQPQLQPQQHVQQQQQQQPQMPQQPQQKQIFPHIPNQKFGRSQMRHAMAEPGAMDPPRSFHNPSQAQMAMAEADYQASLFDAPSASEMRLAAAHSAFAAMDGYE